MTPGDSEITVERLREIIDLTLELAPDDSTLTLQSAPAVGPACPNGTVGHSIKVSGGQIAEGIDFGDFDPAAFLFIDEDGIDNDGPYHDSNGD